MSPSSHAERMNRLARPLLWASHSEAVVLVEGGATREMPGVFRRVMPEGATMPDGVGAQAFQGTATVVVKVEHLPELPGPGAEILRNGETWTIRHGEPQDEWTWILHLARPDAQERMPARFRR